ncbi:MAG: GTP 3',8-cyclase MoaA [Candidatus Verstraetearchaeota archaeon]|jgi:cyclic pyranopterin phosphate synthase|nr:GTP 3',8-cyclase MoaA [Candidatus Verstraetearchaeota archaeon]
MPLIDRYGRPIVNLRITLTHKCNYRCIYCHMEGEEKALEELTPEEIERIARVAVKIGISKVKLTGGEPLIREDIGEIVRRLSHINGMEEVSMTTNGSLLKEKVKELAKANLKRINVNIPSLREETYKYITNSEYSPKQIIEGVMEAKKLGINPVKVNMVILRGVNDDQIDEMITFTRKNDLILQLIELENVGIDEETYSKYHADISSIEEKIKNEAKKVIVRRDMQNRRKYILKGGGEVEIVNPYENGNFCSACTRIRLTADGKIKPCLMRNDNLIDIKNLLRNNLDEYELMKLFVKAIEGREPYWKRRVTP